jgi:hypothetical protein
MFRNHEWRLPAGADGGKGESGSEKLSRHR